MDAQTKEQWTARRLADYLGDCISADSMCRIAWFAGEAHARKFKSVFHTWHVYHFVETENVPRSECPKCGSGQVKVYEDTADDWCVFCKCCGHEWDI